MYLDVILPDEIIDKIKSSRQVFGFLFGRVVASNEDGGFVVTLVDLDWKCFFNVNE